MRKILLLALALCSYVSFLEAQNLARGADVGWLSEMEASGRVWRDSNGVQKDLFDILPDYCINSIRLRVWVDPNGGWSGKQDVVNLAKRAVDKGYRLMVDFHYSDGWADPGQQTKPAAWSDYSVAQLEQAVYDHTYDVLSALDDEGIYPEWVQVGNETNNGMLWPEGQASTNMANYAAFVDRGYEAVKLVFPNAKVIAHVSNGYDNGLFRWNIGGLIDNGARFDVIAMSMYPDSPQEWPEYAAQTLTNMQDMVSRYGKEIMISEIGLATNAPDEARAFVETVIDNLLSLNNNNGLGIFWWEPQAYNWRGYGKVAWNGNSGSDAYEATNAMKGFQHRCSSTSTDCSGEEDGTAFTDDCGSCVGGNTGLEACGPVDVTFVVDMSSTTTNNGVYITGSMTIDNGNWQIIPMTEIGDKFYSYTMQLFPGDTGAYYFLNANEWSSRENVPAECAVYWESDRGFVVGNESMTIENTWSSCENIITAIHDETDEKIKLSPHPFSTSLNIEYPLMFTYSISDLNGRIMEKGTCSNACSVAENLPSGAYLLQIKPVNQRPETLKILKSN